MNNGVESLRQGLKVLLPISELWSWRLGIHLSNSVVTFRVKFHTNFTMMGSEQNFDVGNGEMEKSDRKAIISGNFHLLICFVFLSVAERQETL